MQKVYLQKDNYSLGDKAKEILKDVFDSKHKLTIKIHFGEPGNKTAFVPEDIKAITDYFKSLGFKIELFDSPVVYPSERDTVEGYEKEALKKGFGDLGKVVISNEGESFKSKDYEGEVCKVLTDAKNVLVISHTKGHPNTGFAGAVKNLGMGGVTRETKGIEHNFGVPKFDPKNCTGCGLCSQYCPAGAIKIQDGKAEFDHNKCYGGSLCTFTCPNKCFQDKKISFDDALAQAASEVCKRLPENVYYINFIKNITKLCDCEEDAGEIIAKDVGLTFSRCPIAIDKASTDLIKEKMNEDVFKKVWVRDPLLHVKLAANYLDKKFEYELEEL